MNCYRIKEYVFEPTAGNGAFVDRYSTIALNGEILRVDTASNFTGSAQLYTSGNTSTQLLNATITSGTNSKQSFPFSNTTGSFVINNFIRLAISGVSSGTAVTLGPVSILYR